MHSELYALAGICQSNLSLFTQTKMSDSLHVKFADECYHIGPAPPAESYLNIDRIIETAKKQGADAIHPGYGFLSENEGFAERCEKENIIFIGPKSKAMELTGDKMKCKVLMKKAKVPTVPGSDGTCRGRAKGP